jgi:hypothetical protein
MARSRRDRRFLGRVVGEVGRAEHLSGEEDGCLPVPPEQHAEAVPVTGQRRADQVGV